MEDLLRALSCDRRMIILKVLLSQGPCTSAELRTVLGLPATQRGTLSKDLTVLHRRGLLQREGERFSPSIPRETAGALEALALLDRELTARQAARSEESARKLRSALP
jgi:predicted transcriptional regulator